MGGTGNSREVGGIRMVEEVDEEEDPVLDEEAVSQHDDVDLDNQASDQSPIDTPSE